MLANTFTHARVKKKFQCRPYSVSTEWYPTAVVISNLATPSANSGATFTILALNDLYVRPRANLDTTPDENTKAPPPRSIKLTPNVSVLPNLRGNIVKSIAKIATAVNMASV